MVHDILDSDLSPAGEGNDETTENSVVVSEDDLSLQDIALWSAEQSQGDTLPPDGEAAGLLKRVQTTMVRNPCVAHLLQISVRAALRSVCVHSILRDVRSTFLFFRKSTGGSETLREHQVQSGKKPLRLLLDIPTRWGSTLQMVRRYLKLVDHIDPTVRKLERERLKFGALKPGASLRGSQVNALNSIVLVLEDAEKITAQLGAEAQPTLHLKEVQFPGLLVRVRNTRSTADEGSAAYVLSSDLLKDLESRAAKVWRQEGTLPFLCCAAKFLTPKCVEMKHLRNLGDRTFSVDAAVEAFACIASNLFPDWNSRVNESSAADDDAVIDEAYSYGVGDIIAAAS